MQFLSLRHQGSLLVPYAKAWEYQKSLVEKRVADEIPDTVLFVEHPPTVTRGRGLQWTPERGQSDRAMPIDRLSKGTEYFEIERGGDLTWHGPGQLVIYPIVKLDGSGFGPDHDVTGFLRKLERVIANWLEKYDLKTESREHATGIWTNGKKIASIGIAVRKWVTYHGIGLNLTNSLTGFQEFSPCGFSSEVMTTLEKEVPKFHGAKRDQIEKELASFFADEKNPKVSSIEV